MSWIVTYPFFINTNLVNDIPYYSHKKNVMIVILTL